MLFFNKVMKKVFSVTLWVLVLGLIVYTMFHLHDKEIQTQVKVTHDTIFVCKPIAKDSIIVRKDTIRFPVVKHTTTTTTDTLYRDVVRVDSVDVEIPIERKTYEDSIYFAVVSGYRVNLDSIKVYQRNTIVERYIKSKPKQFGIGIVGGYGLSKDGWTPFVGIGVSYNLFSF